MVSCILCHSVAKFPVWLSMNKLENFQLGPSVFYTYSPVVECKKGCAQHVCSSISIPCESVH